MADLFGDMADRIARSHDCTQSMMVLWNEYNKACAEQRWGEVDAIRMRLVETFEAGLDAQAAIFKRFDVG